MITQGILSIFFAVVNGLFSLLPDVSWDVSSTAMTNFFEVFHLLGYFLPMETVVAIFGLIIVITNFRIGVSIIKTIWQLLPLL